MSWGIEDYGISLLVEWKIDEIIDSSYSLRKLYVLKVSWLRPRERDLFVVLTFQT